VGKTTHIILSSNAGELSPLMDQRLDQEKHRFGCRTLENFFPLIYGSSQSRPGLEYIAGCKSNSAKSRVVPFEHSVDDTYILEFSNQALRFFRNGARVFSPYGTEDLSAIGSIVAHWKCDDNLADTVVVDADGATHNGVASANTTSLTTTDATGTANAAFDLDDTYYVTVGNNADFNFGNGTVDTPFSIAAWVNYTSDGGMQTIISKFNAANREWYLMVMGTDVVQFEVADESGGTSAIIVTNDSLTDGWHFIVATYDGRGGNNAGNGMNIYIDWVLAESAIFMTTPYVAMEALGADIVIGAYLVNTVKWVGKVDNVAIFSKELSASEVASLSAAVSGTAYEIVTPYLTADLFALKFESSADVLFITHPDYEDRKLLRYGHTSWLLEVSGRETGPFLGQNDDIAKTISANVTTGSVTLTALGHSPFKSGTTVGHLPSGSLSTSKSQTGALFKLVHGTGTPNQAGALDTSSLNDTHTALAIPKGITWDFTTNGTWGTAGDAASVVLERSYDGFTTKETIVTVTSAANKNITTSGTEEFADATYRARVSEAGGDASICSTQLSVRDTSHVGIVEITAVASGQSATATVLKTLGSTDKTHRWSEGSFSNYRGWPIDVVISAEERLTFAGSKSKPLNVWGSASGDFTDFSAGTYDDSSMNHSLVGTGQQNRIRWILAKDILILGTIGGEHLFGASKDDEALTPTNKRAKIQTTHGSEDIAALIVNQAILFVQRGGKKIREFLYNFESDSYKADDLTVFANHITKSGIVDMAYQRTPDPMLWCVRDDGQIAVMSYERDQKVFAWSRIVTADSDDDSVFESVAIIYGGAGKEDEIWVTVKRKINDGTVRYIERFKPRDWGSDDEDAFFVDSGVTYNDVETTAMTGATHLVGESVAIYADGEKQDNKTVSATGTFTLDTAASKVQFGLAYTPTFKPMKLNLFNLGLATTKKVLGGIMSFYKTKGGEWGADTDKMNPIVYRDAGQTSAEFPMFTGDRKMPFRAGYERSGDVIVRQPDPYPMTIVALTLEVGAAND